MPRSRNEWTLTQAARALGHPQHRLIYLCEQGVVHPVRDADGRGTSRLFSAANLLQFAIALHLRALEIPASIQQAVVDVLRVFEKRSRFGLPESLLKTDAPDLRIVIRDGASLYLLLRTTPYTPQILGGIDLQWLRGEGRALEDLELPEVGRAVHRDSRAFGDPEGSRYWRVEISVTRVAQNLDFQR